MLHLTAFAEVIRRFSYEAECVDAWKAALTLPASQTLELQLAQVQIVQRQAAGLKLCFYYRSGGPPEFRQSEPDLNVATVHLTAPGCSKGLRVKVFVHRGKFFSLEFVKRPQRFAELNKIRLEDLSVSKVDIHVQLEANCA